MTEPAENATGKNRDCATCVRWVSLEPLGRRCGYCRRLHRFTTDDFLCPLWGDTQTASEIKKHLDLVEADYKKARDKYQTILRQYSERSWVEFQLAMGENVCPAPDPDPKGDHND